MCQINASHQSPTFLSHRPALMSKLNVESITPIRLAIYSPYSSEEKVALIRTHTLLAHAHIYTHTHTHTYTHIHTDTFKLKYVGPGAEECALLRRYTQAS